MTIFGALTLLAEHGNAGEHFAKAGDMLANWGGGDAPFSQWAGMSLGDLPAVLAPIGVVVAVAGLLAVIGGVLAALRGIGLVLLGGFAGLLALVM